MDRLKRLAKKLIANNVDGILIGSYSNRRYLSAFTGSDGWLLITASRACLAVDFRYVEQAIKQSPNFEMHHVKGDISNWLPSLLKDCQITRLAVEADHISLSLYQAICKLEQISNKKIQIIPLKGIVESIRAIKDHDELGYIVKAAEIADRAMLFAHSHLRSGITEKQMAWELECYLRQEGSEPIPFEIIVASGENSAFPHARPTDKVIAASEPITIDLGARYNGYCSDISRTFIIEKPGAKFVAIYNIVLSAQLAGLSVIASGMTGKRADSLIRGVIDKAGYNENFGHGSGHGVGLDIHEQPRLSILSEDVLDDNMVFTIEPGIYIPGWGGIRIEDTVTLDNGKLVCLTKSSKEALIQGG